MVTRRSAAARLASMAKPVTGSKGIGTTSIRSNRAAGGGSP